MLSFLHVTATPVTLGLSPPSHQLSPYSPLGNRTAFTPVLADANNLPAGDHSRPITTCHLKEVDSLITDNQRLPFLNPPPPVCDIGSDTENNSTGTSPNSIVGHSTLAPDTSPCSIFPVHGPFALLYCLQAGGFATAWAAKDLRTGRLLCLKVFQSVQDPAVQRSVQMELEAFKRIVKSKRGENGKQFIIQLNRSMQHDTDVFFAMELMTTDLGTYIDTEPERCKLHARRWMAQIALGIQSLHDMDIIHRDIKPENILIDSRENIRIIDFGLSCLGTSSMPPHSIGFLGTPSYMAPEVLRNKGLSNHQRIHYGVAIDWWALGCILFELESQDHQLLFNAEEDIHAYVASTQRQGKVQEMYPRFEGLDPVVVDLLEGFLQVEPSIRYSLADMKRHVYFLHRNGTSEFDNATARALERPIRPELAPQLTEDCEPIMVIDAAKLATSNDWINLKWMQVYS